MSATVALLQADARPEEGRAIQRTLEVARAAARSKPLLGARVLCVDDNPHNNEIYERNALEQLGVHFVLAQNTSQAFQLLEEQSLDLVITDFERTDDAMGGYTLLAKNKLIAETKGLQNPPPVIIYTGSATPEQRADAKTRGAFGQTNRPQELLNMAVAAILAERSGR